MGRVSHVGETVGHIRITRFIGAGGMGEVYLGFDETLQRNVAIKTISTESRLNPTAKARFLREARALSRLDHPHICKIHDHVEAEANDFLVLEYIDGRNLRDEIAAGIDSSLALRIAEQIADVLVAAHGEGVIHRDIKSTNVMLTPTGDVKVLDFGLARLSRTTTDPEPVEAIVFGGSESPTGATPVDPEGPTQTLTEFEPTGPESPGSGSDVGSIHTVRGTVVGTPHYMSPEQARGAEVTVASDMYSFGLLLREIFTGRRPGVFADDEPADSGSGGGRGRQSSRSGLTGELRTLIEKLESYSPTARPTAAETLDRLRWIRAAPARRNRRILIVAALVIAALIGLKYTFDLRQERSQAIAARDQAEELVDFMVDLFEVSDPGEARGRTITAREILSRGADEVSSRLYDQPATQAKLMETIGVVYTKLGLYEDAAPLLERSLELRRQGSTAESLELSDSLQSLAELYNRSGLFADGERLARKSIAIREHLLGPKHSDVGQSWQTLGSLLENQHEYADAEAAFKQALSIREEALGKEDPRVAESLRSVGIALHMQRRFDDAEPFYRRALAIQEAALGEDHPDVGATSNSLAALCEIQGRNEEAEGLYYRSLEIRERTLGPDHPDVAYSLINIAGLDLAQGRLVEAETAYRRALAIQERSLGPEHPEVGATLLRLGGLIIYLGKVEETETILRRAVAIFSTDGTTRRAQLATAQADLANLLDNTGRYGEAEDLITEALAIREELLPEDDPALAEACFGLAHMYHRHSGRPNDADALYRRAIEIWERSVEPDNWFLVLALNEYVGMLREQGRHPDEAVFEARIPTELRTTTSPLNH